MTNGLTKDDKNKIVESLLEYEAKVAEDHGIDKAVLQSWKRDYFIEQDALSFELEKLKSTLQNIKILKPMLFKKMAFTGDLFQELAIALEIEFGSDHILAAYYCNIGFLAIEQSLFRGSYTSKEDMDIIKRHVYIAEDLLAGKGLEDAARMVKLHHEKPDGTGFLREQNHKDILLALLNIADEFIDVYLPTENKPEPPLTFTEAIDHAFKGYGSLTLLKEHQQKKIKAVIRDFIKGENKWKKN